MFTDKYIPDDERIDRGLEEDINTLSINNYLGPQSDNIFTHIYYPDHKTSEQANIRDGTYLCSYSMQPGPYRLSMNISRIDEIPLTINFNEIKDNLLTDRIDKHIFGLNKNIHKLEAGMAGIFFST